MATEDHDFEEINYFNFKGKKFIGDAKYYQDPENADFEKEFKILKKKHSMVYLI